MHSLSSWPLLFSGVREYVIRSLAEHPSATAREVYGRVKRSSRKAVTYQAVHKVLKQLESEGAVERKGNSYSLSLKWVEKVQQFARELSSNNAKQLGEQTQFVFNSVYEADSFLFSLATKLFQPGDVVCANWSHFWIPLFLNNKTYAGLKQAISKVKFYAITPANTPLDRWCASFWKARGVKHKLSCTRAQPIDCAVVGNWVVQAYYPLALRKALDREYARVKNVRDFDADWFFRRVMEKKTRIPLTVTRNPELATQLRAEFTGEFTPRRGK